MQGSSTDSLTLASIGSRWDGARHTQIRMSVTLSMDVLPWLNGRLPGQQQQLVLRTMNGWGIRPPVSQRQGAQTSWRPSKGVRWERGMASGVSSSRGISNGLTRDQQTGSRVCTSTSHTAGVATCLLGLKMGSCLRLGCSHRLGIRSGHGTLTSSSSSR